MEGLVQQHTTDNHENVNASSNSNSNGSGRVTNKKKNVRRKRSTSLGISKPTKDLSCENDDIKNDHDHHQQGYLGLQKLYRCCKNVFKGVGFVPPPHHVQSLCTILDSMRPEDLGLSKELQFFKLGKGVSENPRVTCSTVYECPKKNFSLVLFFLPPSAVIPLHNHPEMTVLSKLLLGTMHIKAYDWADSTDAEIDHCEQSSPGRLATLKANSVFTAPCNTSVLYPTSGGNIHAFSAITPCVVLDVIGPPYSKKDGRDCTFYTDIMYRSSDGKWEALKDGEHSYAWLKEIDEPEHSKMTCIEYLGPRVFETSS